MVAFIATKFTSPLRIFVTASLTPPVAKAINKYRTGR